MTKASNDTQDKENRRVLQRMSKAELIECLRTAARKVRGQDGTISLLRARVVELENLLLDTAREKSDAVALVRAEGEKERRTLYRYLGVSEAQVDVAHAEIAMLNAQANHNHALKSLANRIRERDEQTKEDE